MTKNDFIDIVLYNILEQKNKSDELKNKELTILSKTYNISLQNLIERYRWLKKMNINPNDFHLEENHKLIMEIFDNFNKMLNESEIEYYYTSGILSYLLVNKPLERYHHDLDVFINMNDLEKLENICHNYNFSFERKNGDRSDTTKRIMLKMYYNNIIDIPITVFMYVKNDDLSIVQKDYFTDENNDKFVEYIYNSPEIVQLSFSNIPQYHNNIKYFAITLEALFLSKNGNREKDIYDCNIFKDVLDKEKLRKLENSLKLNLPNKIIPAENDSFYDFIFNTQIKQKILK